jgi:biotin synthase
MEKQSMINVSIGTAGVLGLAELPMAVAPTTAYLMVGERCSMDCAFCTQARSSASSDLALSRVTWPRFSLETVCVKLAEAERAGTLERCCVQVTTSEGYLARALDTVDRLCRAASLPLSVAIYVRTLEQVETLIARGVDRIGIGLDAACERVFGATKGAHWTSMVTLIEQAAQRYPQRIAVHLVVGLGESEREVVERMVWAHRLRAGVSLFAFTPVRGTRLAGESPPALESYRRLQAARWLIVTRGAGLESFVFDKQGALQALNLPGGERTALAIPLIEGQAFCTSGCPGCNRPFYNERPGGPMYNYARPLQPAEVAQACAEMGLPTVSPVAGEG